MGIRSNGEPFHPATANHAFVVEGVSRRTTAMSPGSACGPVGGVYLTGDGPLRVPQQWHSCAMARERISTTVDGDLLAEARAVRAGLNDAALFDAALGALVRSSRAAEIDDAYAAYDDHPMDEPDEWGDLASFRDAAAAS